MESDLSKRLMWTGLVAVLGALAGRLAQLTATSVWRRVFDEEPPE
jgi:hypothetical protein